MKLYVETEKIVRSRNIQGKPLDVAYLYRVYRRGRWFKKEYLEVAGGYPHADTWRHGSDYYVRFGEKAISTYWTDRLAVDFLLKKIKDDPNMFVIVSDIEFDLIKK